MSSASNDLTEEQREKVVALRRSLADCEDTEGYLDDDDMLRRFLTGHNWSVTTAGKMLRKTLEWRQAENPASWSCRWCIETPGYHSMRQVGFDKLGRPMFYSCFSQTPVTHFTSEDNVQHVVFLLENAIKSMRPPQFGAKKPETWLWVLDCTGMGMAACNPRLSTSVNSILSAHYPERLGCVFAVNAGYLMRAAWAAIRVFLHPATAAKLSMSSYGLDRSMSEFCDKELLDWLQREIDLNKTSPFPESQRRFWEGPSLPEHHDPRGTASYVREFIESADNLQPDETDGNSHQPHPNIVRRYSAAF